MPLLSIEEHDKRIFHINNNHGNFTYVECPRCGKELQWLDKHISVF